MAAILEQHPHGSRVVERSLALLAAGAVLAFCYLARELLVPALVGVFGAYAVNPVVRRLHRWLPRWAAALCGTVLALLVVAGLLAVLWVQLDALSREWPEYEQRLRELSRTVGRRVARLRRESEQLVPAAAAPGTVKVDSGVPWGTLLLGTARSAAGMGMGLLVATFTLYFSLADGPRYREKLLAAAPSARVRGAVAQALSEVHRDVGQYLVNRVVLNSATGLVAGVAFAAYGLRHAAIWAVTTAVCRFIPFVGTALGFALPVGMALVQGGSMRDPLVVGAIYLVIVFLQGNVVDPIFLGRQLRMNSLAVFLGSLFWYWIWGPVGLLLAVPLLATVKIVCAHVPRLRLAAELLGE